MDADTIFAVASGAGQAAIAVMRLSGPASRAHAGGAVRAGAAAAAGRRCAGCAIEGGLDRRWSSGCPVPAATPARTPPNSTCTAAARCWTGVADALVALGARPAEPGEFTRRAFLNGRMDLTEAEAVHDLIAAETEAQRRQALRQLDGALGTLYRGWADRLRAAAGAAGGADRLSRTRTCRPRSRRRCRPNWRRCAARWRRI